MSSCSELTLKPLARVTERVSGTKTVGEIGSRSRSGLYGSEGYSASAITAEATKPVTGPRPMTVPNGRRRMIRVAASAPTTMPTPYIASVTPTPLGDRPRWRKACEVNSRPRGVRCK